MLMTYLMSYVLYLIHLMYFSLMLGRVMLTCDAFALVGWTSTPKCGLSAVVSSSVVSYVVVISSVMSYVVATGECCGGYHVYQ